MWIRCETTRPPWRGHCAQTALNRDRSSVRATQTWCDHTYKGALVERMRLLHVKGADERWGRVMQRRN
jgi:hypothetical protein